MAKPLLAVAIYLSCQSVALAAHPAVGSWVQQGNEGLNLDLRADKTGSISATGGGQTVSFGVEWRESRDPGVAAALQFEFRIVTPTFTGKWSECSIALDGKTFDTSDKESFKKRF